MTENLKYHKRWAYTPCNARTYEPVFALVAQGQAVSVPLPAHLHHLNSLDLAIRCAYHWLRNHGSYNDLQCKIGIRTKAMAVLVRPVVSWHGHQVHGEPYVIHDAQGRQLWQHSPPLDERQGPGNKGKRMTSSKYGNSSGKIRPATRARKSAGALEHFGFEADGSGI